MQARQFKISTCLYRVYMSIILRSCSIKLGFFFWSQNICWKWLPNNQKPKLTLEQSFGKFSVFYIQKRSFIPKDIITL